MIQGAVKIIKKIFENIFRKKIVYFPKNLEAFGRTAVKSEDGFWYVGDVLESHDLAYGVLHNGSIEPEGTSLVKNILKQLMDKKNSLTFYDIGANTGYYGILAAFLGQGKIKTYAFDPVCEFNEAEKESARLNRLDDNVEIFNMCLGEKDGEIKIHLAGSGTTMKAGFLGKSQFQTRLVPIRELDNLLSEKHLTAPDFVKIDVEGAEMEVIKGAQNTIKNYKPIIWYESAKTMPERKFINSEFERTHEFLETLGYQIYLCGINGLKKIDSAPVPAGVWMYLALPEGNNIVNLKL